MKKHICDICGGELVVPPRQSDGIFGLLGSVVRVFTCKNPFTVRMHIAGILAGKHKQDLEFCSKCFDEFREFIQRKNQNFIPQERSQNGTDRH